MSASSRGCGSTPVCSSRRQNAAPARTDDHASMEHEKPIKLAGFPLDELPLGEGMELVQAVGKLLEFVAVEFRRGVRLRVIGQMNCRETRDLIIAHDASAWIASNCRDNGASI